MVFSEFPYERVDLQAEGEKIDALIEQFKNAATAQEAIACVEQFNALQHHAGTMRTISNIRASVNTADSFYDQEQKYYGTHMPAIQQKTVVFQNLMLESPFRAELEQEYPDVKFAKVNVDEEPELAREFKVQSIPFVAFVKDNVFLDMSVGYVPKDKLKRLVEEYR